MYCAIPKCSYKNPTFYPISTFEEAVARTTMCLLALTVIFSFSKAICISNNVEFFIFKTFPSMDGKIAMQPAIFYLNHSSPVQCLRRCTTTHGCVSVFLSAGSVCQGHLEVFETTTPFLFSKPGVVYYVSKDHAGLFEIFDFHKYIYMDMFIMFTGPP